MVFFFIESAVAEMIFQFQDKLFAGIRTLPFSRSPAVYYFFLLMTLKYNHGCNIIIQEAV